MIDVVTIGFLCALLVFQHWYWSRETHRLIDKVMSRNYPEYVSSVSYLKPKSSPGPEKFPDFETQQEQELLGELNGMLGP